MSTTGVEVIVLGTEETANGERYEMAVVQKASRQAAPERADQGLTWLEPRMGFDSLNYFQDVSTWHKRCIVLKARLVGGLGFRLETEDADKTEDAQHVEIMALLRAPQREGKPGELRLSLTEILQRFLTDWYGVGNAFLEAPRNARGEVAEIYHVRAPRIRRDRDLSLGYHNLRNGTTAVRFRGFGGEQPAGTNELLHFLQYDPQDDYYGVPEWLGAMGALYLDRQAVEYNTWMFRNSLMAQFAVIVEGGKLDARQMDSLKTFLQNNATGVQNAGRGMVLQNEDEKVKIRIEKLNIDWKDLKFSEGRAFSRDEIVAAHGVPPRMVGIIAAGSLGGGGEVEGQLKTFLETVIRPDQQQLEDFLNATIIASFGGEKGLDGVKWRLKFNELDWSNPQTDAAWYTAALNPQTGWMRRDEVRQELELPAEDADVDADALAGEIVSDPAKAEKAAQVIAGIRKQLA